LSYTNLSSASKTLASRIWNAIKGDKQLGKIIRREEQIIVQTPEDSKTKDAHISVFLYNVTELSSMRNQPQNPEEPRTLLNLNLHYLITPLTQNAETDQILLGKIMQVLAEKPILRGSDLQGSLKEGGDELKVVLDALSIDDLNKLWAIFRTPYKLSASYTLHPVRIEASTKPKEKTVAITKQPLPTLKLKNSDKKA
jgi:hypothetical protein